MEAEAFRKFLATVGPEGVLQEVNERLNKVEAYVAAQEEPPAYIAPEPPKEGE